MKLQRNNNTFIILSSVTPDTTDIQEFEQEILIQGHPGTIYGLTSSLEDQFVSSGMQFKNYIDYYS